MNRDIKSEAVYFCDVAAYHRPQMDGVQDVPDSLRFLYELHGESGTWQGIFARSVEQGYVNGVVTFSVNGESASGSQKHKSGHKR